MVLLRSLFCIIGCIFSLEDTASHHNKIAFCKKTSVGKCEANLNLISKNRPPVCYCDIACELFNDCCFDYPRNARPFTGNQINMTQLEHLASENQEEIDELERSDGETSESHQDNQSKKQIGIAEQVPLYLMDTCLRINGAASGFWIVNECPKYGRKCSESMGMSDVIRNLPVTDLHNVTYFGAECAICNNVTNFTTWGILADSSILDFSREIDIPLLIEDSNFGTLQYNLEKIGKIELIPPLTLSYRVCHNFSSKARDITTGECPDYQCPVVHEVSNQIIAVYRNPECCEMSGSCFYFFQTGWKEVQHVLSFEDLQTIRLKNGLYIGAFIRPGNIQQPCDALLRKKTPSKTYQTFYDDSCLSSKFEVFNYPLRDRILTLTMVGYYNNMLTVSLYSMLYTYFLNSQWHLHFGKFLPLYHSKNGRCRMNDMVCTKVKIPLELLSNRNTSLKQIYYLESWTEYLSFTLHINTTWYDMEAEGTLSRNLTKLSKCLCNNDNFTQSEIRHLDFRRPPIAWKTSRNDCIDHELKMKSVKEWGRDIDVLEVYCKQDISGEANFDSANMLSFSFILTMHVVIEILK